ncbi:thiamine pyrophosphate-dependent enzyme [Kitasatospora purpeofusca]|uniref:thiamine pyrophosphate-dependent enzyme n=1 Tax=Kitasatospora purpeofusca TaxID=67352 RepID=UPI0033E821B6
MGRCGRAHGRRPTDEPVRGQKPTAVVAVVLNDSAYGNVARSQHNRFGHSVATALLNPDFVRLAEAFGAHGVRAHTPEQLGTRIAAALARGDGLPTVIEVPVTETTPSRTGPAQPTSCSPLPPTRPPRGPTSTSPDTRPRGESCGRSAIWQSPAERRGRRPPTVPQSRAATRWTAGTRRRANCGPSRRGTDAPAAAAPRTSGSDRMHL